MTGFTRRTTTAALFAFLALTACDDGTGPATSDALEFGQPLVALGQARDGSIVIRNAGSDAVGPVEVVASPVLKAGIEIPGVGVATTPTEIPTLNPGDSVVVQLVVTGATGLQSGTYLSELQALVQGSGLATASVTFLVPVPQGLVGSVEIVGLPDSTRQGEVISLGAVVRDTLGLAIEDAEVSWSTMPVGAGLFTIDGEFVPYRSGAISLVARAGERADTTSMTVSARAVAGTFSVVGRTDITSRWTSDLWVFGNAAITGTWGNREFPGNTMYAWDISGATPVLTDSIAITALTIDDVMIRADGELAVLTHEYMSPSHAITLVDMADPLHPVVAGEYHSDIDGAQWIGVHNAWLEGDYAYIVVDGAAENRGLWIIDVSDPANPHRVARFYAGSSFLHDVIVRDGLAFLSHWDAGLIILDVGHGIRGGSPTNPVEVSRIVTSGGDVHNAWYWPETGYVFIGEEDFMTPGRLHVVDASDLENPVEVANMRVPGDTPHNYWLDEERAILYTSWYSEGVQAVDVSGRLIGSLDLQGRLFADLVYDGGAVWNCPGDEPGTCAWAPQLHEGFLYVADMNSGLWKLQPNF